MQQGKAGKIPLPIVSASDLPLAGYCAWATPTCAKFSAQGRETLTK